MSYKCALEKSFNNQNKTEIKLETDKIIEIDAETNICFSNL